MLFWMRSKTYMRDKSTVRKQLTVENKKSREKKRICSGVSVNSPGNPCSQSRTSPHTHTRTQPFNGPCPGLPGWAGTRRNIHPLTPIFVTRHPLWTSSVYYDPRHPPCSVYVLGSPFSQALSRSSLVFLLVWDPVLHTPYIHLTILISARWSVTSFSFLLVDDTNNL